LNNAALPWLGAGLAGFLVTGALGWAGVLGRPKSTETAARLTARVSTQVSYLDCPGGSPLGTFGASDRVLGVAHDGDDWVAVRNPTNVLQIVWLPASVLVPDDGQEPFGELPAATCATVDAVALPADTTTVPTTSPTPTLPATTTTVVATTLPTTNPPATTLPATNPPATTVPATNPPATNPPLTSPPVTTPPPNAPPAVGNLSANPTVISQDAQCQWSTQTQISVNVTDASGVGAVQVRWSISTFNGPASGTVNLVGPAGGGNWTGTISGLLGPNPTTQLVQLRVTATDAQQLQTVKNFDSTLTVEFCLP